MKKIYYLFFAVAFVFTGCEDYEFIQPEPKDRITQDIALEDLAGIEAVVASGYNRLINFNNYGQTMLVAPDALADNLELGNNTGRYDGEIVNEVRTHIDLVNDPGNPNNFAYTVRSAYNAYRGINDFNIALFGLAQDGIRDEDVDLANQLEGEARFLRALSYFDLLRVYSYEPGQEVNGFNLGVVLREDPVFGAGDATADGRSTNVEGYALLEADLLAAINLLPAEADNADFPARASATAAEALLARVYLYQGRYSEAATRADNVIAATSATLSTVASYATDWAATSHPEAIFELWPQAVDWNTVDGVNNSMATVTRTSSAALPNAQGAVKLSDELIAAFEAGDVRATLINTPSDPDFYESDKWSGDLGDFRDYLPIIRLSEVYLISAEGKARSGDDSGAQTTLNTLRTNRGLAATTATGGTLTSLIMNERRVELYLEGHRWFDLKRLGMDIPKPAASGASTLQYTDFRILAPFDQDYLSLLDDVEQNPNY